MEGRANSAAIMDTASAPNIVMEITSTYVSRMVRLVTLGSSSFAEEVRPGRGRALKSLCRLLCFVLLCVHCSMTAYPDWIIC
jgi:hypothetical protein